MADNETPATAETASAPVEHDAVSADAQPLLEILEDLSGDETAADPVPVDDDPKSGEVFEPLGNVVNRP